MFTVGIGLLPNRPSISPPSFSKPIWFSMSLSLCASVSLFIPVYLFLPVSISLRFFRFLLPTGIICAVPTLDIIVCAGQGSTQTSADIY